MKSAVAVKLGMMAVVVLMIGLAEDARAFGTRRSSAGSGSGEVVTAPVSTPTPVPVNVPSNEDTSTGGVKVVINSATNFNSEQLAHLEASRSLLEKIVNSEEFKQRVLHFSFNGQEAFYQNNGLSNLQIYNKIMAAAEELPKVTPANQIIDLTVQLYTSSWFGRNVVGYTNPDTSTIYMNTYFYNYATPGGTASNMMHEWMHKLGFDHDYRSTSSRPYSVPYAIGDIVEQMGN
jgi:hypothetical protein